MVWVLNITTALVMWMMYRLEGTDPTGVSSLELAGLYSFFLLMITAISLQK